MKTAALDEAYFSVPRLLTSARRKATLPERSAKQEFGQTGATFQWPGGKVVVNPRGAGSNEGNKKNQYGAYPKRLVVVKVENEVYEPYKAICTKTKEVVEKRLKSRVKIVKVT